MTQTKKLILSPVPGFLLLSCLAILVFAARPPGKAVQGNATRLGLKLIADANAKVTTADIDQAATVIASRLSALGVNLATVEPSSTEGEHLKVMIPAGLDIKRIKEVITFYGRLELIPLMKDTEAPYLAKEAAERAAKSLSKSSFEILKFNESDSYNGNGQGWVIVEKTALITGADIREARAVKSQFGVEQYEIAFTLSPEGASRFSDWTGNHIGAMLAIVLNREVKSAPRVQSQIADQGQITGRFTKQSAETLAIALTSGRLPYRVEVVSEQAASAKEGVQRQSVQSGGLVLTLRALFVGFVFVLTR